MPESVAKPPPVMAKMCPTCPFREKGYKEFRGLLMFRALAVTPICHSTGDSNLTAPEDKIHTEEYACRGARNQQLRMMHEIGFLKAPTDEAWFAKRRAMGMDMSRVEAGK